MIKEKIVPMEQRRKQPRERQLFHDDECEPLAPSHTPEMNSSHLLKLLLTPQEAANALSINRSTLYLMLMRGEIPSITIGRARRIPVQALTAWIAQQLAA